MASSTKRLVTSPLLRRHVDFCRHTLFSRTTCSSSYVGRIDWRFNHVNTNNSKLSVLRYAPYSSSSSLSSSSINNNNNNNNIIKGENENETTANTTIPVPETLVSILDDNYQEMIDRIPLEDIRNFCFIAHVDHGKSSLSSRLLEITGNNGRENQKIALESARNNINALDNDGTEHSMSSGDDNSSNDQPDEKEQIQLLDTLAVERERGITVKASAASMLYPHPSAVGPDGVILLNCVDTPGHSDFSSEVARSLSFVQGAVLLLDAAQGIQAQTWTVYEKAKSMTNPPEVILALTKIDLDVADPINVALTVSEWLSVEDPESIIPTSARSRIGIVPLLDKICRMVPPPSRLPDDNYIEDNDNNQHLRAQVVDSWYDERGVNCLVQIASGTIAEGDRIAIVTGTKSSTTSSSVQSFSVQEVGIVLPHSVRTGKLRRGQMGYVRFGLKDPSQVDTGTILIFHKDVGKDIYIPSINQSIINDNSADSTKSVLFASVHPLAEDGFEDLCDAVDRLGLNDKGLEISRTSDGGANNSESGGPFLGPGLRIGFQGLLHVEVFRQRLTDEFGIDAVVTPPKVPYHVTFLPSKANNLTDPIKRVVEDLEDWPVFGEKFRVEEPMVEVRLMSPVQYAGAVMELITNKRGIDLTTKPIDENIWMFQAQMPWAEVVLNFHDMLKTITGGYGSLGTFEADPPLREARLSKVEILLNGDEVGPLSFVCHTPNAQSDARIVCKKLKDVLPRQQFVIVIQAKADGKVIASERIQAYRKDVLNKSGKMVGGGDISRKKKLLEKQKKGKKRSQSSGKVTLSQAAFNSVISR